jgi:putative ABC transport system permease protein
MLDSLLRDLRFSVRLLAARPGWTVAAIVCLAIATGANTAAFSIINGLLLRPLPFDEPDQLVMVALREPLKTGPRPFALHEYRELSSRSDEVAMLLARTFFPLSLSADDGAQMAEAELVSGNYFDVLRVKPFAGRFFDANSDRRRGELQGVLSHALWLRRFGADPSVVGRSLRVNGRPMVVAGIAPPGFVGAMQLIAADLWLPAAVYPELTGSAGADTVPMFGVMGRLVPTVRAEQAEERLTSIAAALPRTSAASPGPPAVVVAPAAGFGVPVAVAGTVLKLSEFIYVMMALLMAVACANVAALVLARGTGRTREIAVRLSLGASRMQIARQLLTESLVLALAGSAAGIVAALWLTQALVARLTTPFQYVGYAIDVHPDARVFVYCSMVTVLAAVFCGVAPIRHAARVNVVDLLKQAAAKGGSRESRRTLSATVVVQFAVSTMLLIGAGMLVRPYLNAQSTQSVVQPSGLLAASIDADQINPDRPAGVRLYGEIIERLSARPGITDVALTQDLPLGRGRTMTVTADAGAASSRPGSVDAVAMLVSSHYFHAVGAAIGQGRAFGDTEPARPHVAVINEAMARRLWPGASPMGRTFRVSGRDDEPIAVIGTLLDPGEPSRTQGAQPSFYRPFPQEYSARMTVLIRVHGDSARFFPEVRGTIRDINPDLSIVDLRTVDQLIDDADAQRRIPAAVLSFVGLLAVLLSAVGLYGVVAYGVRQRAHELGIRLALGARPADVKRLVLRQGFAMVGIGSAIGIGGAIAVAQVVRSALFGVEGLDAPALAVVCAVLSAAAFAALYLPARWASNIEPAQTLRSE